MTNLSSLTVWELARMAGCADPDSSSTPGADFLRTLREDVRYRVNDAIEGEELADMLREPHDLAHEIADGCVPIYTREVWETFADLGAWLEDPTELGFDGSDMEQGAKVCLYVIAERLVMALLELVESSLEDDAEDGEA